MKKNFAFLISLIIFFNSFSQNISLCDLKQQLNKIGKDTSSLRAILVVLSDEVNDENAALIVPTFDRWAMPLHNVDFIFTGKRKVFKEKFGDIILDKNNVFLDSKSMLKVQMSSDHVMEVYYLKEDKIVKQASASNSDFSNEFIDIRAWDAGKPYSKSMTSNNEELLAIRTKAPSLLGISTKGKEIDLQNLEGSIVILNFWSDRCAPCIVEMPIFNRLRSEYQNRNVIFLSIYKDSLESLEKYFSDEKPYFKSDFITFPIIANAERILEDYKIESFPKTYIIDQSGIVAHTSGFTTFSDETFDLNGVKSDHPYYYLSLKGTIDKLLIE